MSTTANTPELASTPGAAEQLSLLNTSAPVPLQFRLSEHTRVSGLAHVSALRAQLAAQAAARATTTAPERRSSRQIAA
ncbi:MAG: hypothetical protein F2659_06125 [Actinobacteria bacterium]|uniref:Unannotated protein n=1 Tax=freshwater metagenome TaxID=449393 RepID=A0A6J6PPJ5_9ZZZZ|nr:hypothetical protein [Actinomycetota bacterium]